MCFVAHNGDRFDYPILKAELYKIGCELYDDILCIDSLQMFRHLEEPSSTDLKESGCNGTVVTSPESQKLSKEIPIELCDGYDEILLEAINSFENECGNTEKVQIMNESTPKKTINTSQIFDRGVMNDSVQDQLYFAPTSTSFNKNTKSDNTVIVNPPKARKRLNLG